MLNSCGCGRGLRPDDGGGKGVGVHGARANDGLAQDATMGTTCPGARASGAGPQSCEARGTRRAWWRERIRGTPLLADVEDGSWSV
jgi:hypothetical protein